MSRSLNILHTVQYYAPHIGGAETVVQKISEELVNRGHRVTVATTKLPERDFQSLNGVEIVEFDVDGNEVNGYQGTEASAYLDFLQAIPADVMMNYAAQQWASDLAFEVLKKRQGPAVRVFAPCGYSAISEELGVMKEYYDYYTKTIPAVLNIYDACVYHSAHYQDYRYGKRLNLHNDVIIPNFVDQEEFMAPLGVDFRAKYEIKTRHMLLSVGNFMEGKGQDRVIQAFYELRDRDTTLVLIGNDHGTKAELEAQAAGLNVRFLSGISRSDTVAAFRSADIFLFGSFVEASPLVIVEAKAARIPFVSTDCGNVREFKGGIVCQPTEMASHARNLLDDENRRRALAEEGWSEWQERLTQRAVVSQYEALYQLLIDRKTQAC